MNTSSNAEAQSSSSAGLPVWAQWQRPPAQGQESSFPHWGGSYRHLHSSRVANDLLAELRTRFSLLCKDNITTGKWGALFPTHHSVGMWHYPNTTPRAELSVEKYSQASLHKGILCRWSLNCQEDFHSSVDYFLPLCAWQIWNRLKDFIDPDRVVQRNTIPVHWPEHVEFIRNYKKIIIRNYNLRNYKKL